MSSNLVKQFFMTLPEDKEKLVIDNNDRIRRRLEELSRGEGNPEGGFVSGLAIADVIETPEDATGNVIKAQDEAKELLESYGVPQPPADIRDFLLGQRSPGMGERFVGRQCSQGFVGW